MTFNSSPPSAAYTDMRKWIGSALAQIMACRLFYAKPLFSANAGLLSIGPSGINFSEIRIEIQTFSLTKVHLKISSAKCRQLCPGRDELKMNLTISLEKGRPLKSQCVNRDQSSHTYDRVTMSHVWLIRCWLGCLGCIQRSNCTTTTVVIVVFVMLSILI